MITIDATQIDGLCDVLATAPEQAVGAAYVAGIGVGKEIQARGQAAAPEDRPWLKTRGIRRRSWRSKAGAHTDVFGVPDPEGRPVAFFVEAGTSEVAPNPFLSTQMTWASYAYEEAIVAGLDPLAGKVPVTLEDAG